MRTTDGLTRAYMDSSVVSIPLTAAGTEIGGGAVAGKVDAVAEAVAAGVDDVDDCLVTHPAVVIASARRAVITHRLLFIIITPRQIVGNANIKIRSA